MSKRRTYRVLRRVMIVTKADRIWLGFIVFFLICTTIFWLQEAHIETWGEAFWYSFALVSTVGFGDVLVLTPLSRVLSVILSVYAVFVIAILTAVVVSLYKNLIEYRLEKSFASMADKIERLPELSKEELTEISEDFKKLRAEKSEKWKKKCAAREKPLYTSYGEKKWPSDRLKNEKNENKGTFVKTPQTERVYAINFSNGSIF